MYLTLIHLADFSNHAFEQSQYTKIIATCSTKHIKSLQKLGRYEDIVDHEVFSYINSSQLEPISIIHMICKAGPENTSTTFDWETYQQFS